MVELNAAEMTGNLTEMQDAQKKEKEEALYKSEELGKDDFLQLLITSLQHQDPMSPASNEEFIAQMAQFSSLENSSNMLTSLDKMTEKLEGLMDFQRESANTISSASATSLLGKEVRVKQSGVLFDGKSAVTLKVHVNDGENALVSITDKDGEVVNAIAFDKDGEHDFAWDGSTAHGTRATPGEYDIKVTNFDGSRDVGYGFYEDKVTGIRYTSDGVLMDFDGTARPFEDIVYIRDAVEKQSGEPLVTEGQ